MSTLRARAEYSAFCFVQSFRLTISILLRVRRVGGLHFAQVGRLGGCVYLKRA